MKRILLAFALVAAAAAAFAVDDSAPRASSGAFTAGPSEAMVILNQLGLYAESAGTLTLKEGLAIGDKVVVAGRAQKFKVDKSEREYIKVRTQAGTEGWVRSPYALPKVSLAVVKADQAVLYSQPRDISVSDQYVSKMTIVAVFQDGGTAGFAKVNCYDAEQNVYFTESDKYFVAKEDLSFSDTDINAVIVYQTAMASKNKKIRSNLFGVIEKKYSSSQFFDEIRAQLAPETAPKATVPAVGSYVLNDDNVNVRAQPDEVSGTVLAKLGKGTFVAVVEATVQSYAIGGASAPWYKIAEPEGWVFGSFLSPAP